MVDKFLLTLQIARLAICSFWKMCKTRMDCAKLALAQSHGDVMSAGLTGELIDVQKYRKMRTLLLYKKYFGNLFLSQVFMARDEEVFDVVVNLEAAL